MLRKIILLLSLVLVGAPALAANKVILLTGYWAPTNEMLRKFSTERKQNPGRWVGKNWRRSGYDVYAYFPEYPNKKNTIGTGDFRVDFAATYNDFMKFTRKHKPVAILNFGRGDGPWEIEAIYPPHYQKMFVEEKIPSTIGLKTIYPIPDSLKENVVRRSSLPLEAIAHAVNTTAGAPRARVDYAEGAGDYLCGFLGYLSSWYHDQHAESDDPAHNVMAGFIHVDNRSSASAKLAVDATLKVVIQELDRKLGR